MQSISIDDIEQTFEKVLILQFHCVILTYNGLVYNPFTKTGAYNRI